ncbi:MAG: hypothetical protein HC802_18545 [Caldilineaceae bacterium]|nr:hypothetical protein [Caldilineaceae bacterium]
MKLDLAKIVAVFSVVVFPLTLFWFAYQYKVDEFNYIEQLREDRPVEWLSVAFLLLAAVLALDVAIQIRQQQGLYDWFFFAFAAFCFVVALEEISWGQRVLDFQSPELFLTKSDQQEVNVHNLLQQQLDFKTKDVAGLALFLYGFILPLLALIPRLGSLLSLTLRLPKANPRHRFRLVLPPRVLMLGFLLGGLLMLDEPTGFEEEIGEMFFALCFFLFMLIEALSLREDGAFKPFAVSRRAIHLEGDIGRAALLTLTLFTAWLQLWSLDRKGLGLDEATVWLMAQAPLSEMAANFWQHGLGFSAPWVMLLHSWLSLAGQSEVALRLLPAFAAVLTIPLFWQLLSRAWPGEGGLRVVATTLVATAPALLLSGQSARAYAFVTLLAVLSLCATMALAARPRLATGLVFVVVNWMLLLTQPGGVYLILAETLVLALHRARPNGKPMRWIIIPAILALLPVGWFVIAGGQHIHVGRTCGAG